MVSSAPGRRLPNSSAISPEARFCRQKFVADTVPRSSLSGSLALGIDETWWCRPVRLRVSSSTHPDLRSTPVAIAPFKTRGLGIQHDLPCFGHASCISCLAACAPSAATCEFIGALVFRIASMPYPSHSTSCSCATLSSAFPESAFLDRLSCRRSSSLSPSSP